MHYHNALSQCVDSAEAPRLVRERYSIVSTHESSAESNEASMPYHLKLFKKQRKSVIFLSYFYTTAKSDQLATLKILLFVVR